MKTRRKTEVNTPMKVVKVCAQRRVSCVGWLCCLLAFVHSFAAPFVNPLPLCGKVALLSLLLVHSHHLSNRIIPFSYVSPRS